MLPPDDLVETWRKVCGGGGAAIQDFRIEINMLLHSKLLIFISAYLRLRGTDPLSSIPLIDPG